MLGGQNDQIIKKISPQLKNKVPRFKFSMVPEIMILNKSNPLPRITILKLRYINHTSINNKYRSNKNCDISILGG